MPSLWSTARRTAPTSGSGPASSTTADVRTDLEKDYDRLLFSTPVRRLADKTQVFPLERNDSVRNRLTHSHEVSNLARSIANRLLRTDRNIFGEDGVQAAPVLLAAAGLAHDLGNPPFGHQGEVVIATWFEKNKSKVLADVPDRLQPEFLKFEGNAQTIRLVTRLQLAVGGYGLNLTAATLAALMKYPTTSDRVDESKATTKKYGYFEAEHELVSWMRDETGLGEGQRHPLTWLMEACDDIAYSTLDVEDAIKKAIVSPEDVVHYLKRRSAEVPEYTLTQLTQDFQKVDEQNVPPSITREIKTSYLRARLIEALMTGAANGYVAAKSSIESFDHSAALLESDNAESRLCKALKDYALEHAYRNADVLRLELEGDCILRQLMDCLWRAITERKSSDKLGSKRTTAFASYAYALISPNYRHIFETHEPKDRDGRVLPVRYRECRLLTDMIAGMTDSFALELHSKLHPRFNV